MIIGGREKGFLANAAAVAASAFSSPFTETKIVTTGDRPTIDKLKIDKNEGALGDSRKIQAHQFALPDLEAGLTQPASGAPAPIVATPVFKLVFLAVLGITVLSGLIEIAIAVQWPAPTANQQATFESFGFAWKAGLGAIFGLLGGKVT
jgi:hypothetical protein